MRGGNRQAWLSARRGSRTQRVQRALLAHARRVCACACLQVGQEVVLLGQVLADEATLGYEDVANVQVRHTGRRAARC
jgi:hypothetical protein